MASQRKIREALLSISNVADFLRRNEDVSERTVYRQRAPNPPAMRPSIARRIERALVKEGLIRGKKEDGSSRGSSSGKVAGRDAEK